MRKNILRILKQGTEAWNTWRLSSPDIMINLNGAYLSGADLSGTNLSRADLSDANLSRANLIEANLNGADLSGTDLSGAYLNGAKLSGAKLSRVDLSRSKLTKSDLSNADLSRADLRDANLSGADLRGANLYEVTDVFIFGPRPREANLRGADLSEANLHGINLRRADLRNIHLNGVILREADLREANLSGANLCKADLSEANLNGANLNGADLSEADLSGADLTAADLSGADLTGATLRVATLISTNFTNAILSGCRIYGISAWNVKLKGAIQTNLDISNTDAALTVDNLEVAQFIYMLIYNEKIRDVIQTIGNKAVLILGRFTPERKAILDTLRNALRSKDRLPIVFDFVNADNRNLTETVRTLAFMSRFIIADITEASSIPQELQAIVPSLPSVPVQPILLASERTFGMFHDFFDYQSVLALYRYDSVEHLLETLDEKIIAPAEAKAKEIEERRKRLV